MTTTLQSAQDKDFKDMECTSSPRLLAAEGSPSRSERFQECLDKTTTFGVNLSVFAFIGLQIPQIVQNLEEDPAQMANLSWAGYVSGSVGNLLLATYFAGSDEWAQVRVQGIGAVTNYAVATQVFLAGYFPPVQFGTLAVIIAVGLVMPLLYSMNVTSLDQFNTWKEATTPIGFAALVFSITATSVSNTGVLLAVAVAGFLVGMSLLVLKPRCPSIAPLTSTLGGWLATLLFMWMPLPQLVKIITEGAEAAAAFSMGFTILATIGNGLGSTRGFVIKDKIWFTGSFFGLMVGGWATAAAVWAVRPEQCPFWVLISYTAFLLIYWNLVVYLNGVAKKESLCRQVSFLFT